MHLVVLGTTNSEQTWHLACGRSCTYSCPAQADWFRTQLLVSLQGSAVVEQEDMRLLVTLSHQFTFEHTQTGLIVVNGRDWKALWLDWLFFGFKIVELARSKCWLF
jgi:hypothetical protein